ncbi:Holliday junction resolvase RuvX [Seongchinamella sediminis]|uniref:Putative pre-16S rRNA nuclease n=1 Tax=Seongchinamella sediminis TaxID=2283635 RepID=A0A3L7DYI9_9GAMM|nr:Holliday junction resolvase RuvX [Seongchinamella sediminis]RLQ20932.1 Holliday junction resolvase RuvX [Seongchinamella sediminis]
MNKPPRTVLAFDYGLHQIGVATGNTLLGTSRPLPILRARDGIPDWGELAKLVAEWQPDLLLVGEPLNMDDSPSELSARANKFARRLQGRLGLAVVMVDERLSSFEAKQQSRERGHRGNYNADPIDSLAAELILQTWLAEQTAGNH